MMTLKKLMLMFLLPLTAYQSVFAENKPDELVYIFGFGSLMSTPARTATKPDPVGSVYIPVYIRDFTRKWDLWIPSSQERALNLEETTAGYVNGLIFATKKSELADFDKREGAAYLRRQLPTDNIAFYRDEDRTKVIGTHEDVKIYAYFPNKSSSFYVGRGNAEQKIAMSYLDVVRSGCIEIDHLHRLNGRFIDDCVATMGLEGYAIEDDTDNPRYPRYPATLMKKARKRAEELDRFMNQDWPYHLEIIRDKWGF